MSSSQPAEKQTPAAEVEAGEHVKAAPSSTAAAAAAADTTKLKDEEMQDVPDPDEDDLDDLDGMTNRAYQITLHSGKSSRSLTEEMSSL
jgi:hypothetical protein